jgi:hypothetical protein
MVIAIVVVVSVVALVARGRGGGLSAERADYVPLDLGPVTATDVALLRPPAGLWGYNVQATDEALEHIAESIRERDVRIVALEQLVTDLSRDHAPAMPLASPYSSPRHLRTGFSPSYQARPGYDDTAWEASYAPEPAAPPAADPLSGAYQPEPRGYDPSWFEARSTGPLPAAAEPPAAYETPAHETPLHEAPTHDAPAYEAPAYETPAHEGGYDQPGPSEQPPPERSHD